MMRTLLIAACFVSSGIVSAQDLVIRNARIIAGADGTIVNGTIVARAGRIVSVGTGSEPLEGVADIDAAGMTVIPGMIETHAHLLIRDRMEKDSQEALKAWIEAELPAMLAGYLEAGFTTVLDTGGFLESSLEVRGRLAAGTLLGPRLLAAGPVFTAPGSHPAATICTGAPSFCREFLSVEVSDVEAAREKVREFATAGVDAIKIVYQANNPAMASRISDDVFQAMTEEADRFGIPVIVHAPVADEAYRAVELGAKRLVHPPVISSDSIVGETLGQLLLDAEVPFATTSHLEAPLMDEAGNRTNHFGAPYTAETAELLERRLATIRQLWDEGVTIAFGTDWTGRPSPAQTAMHEITVISEVLSNAEIVAALTRNGARFLGLEDEIGTLEAGKAADMVILNGNPLIDITALGNIEVVIKGAQIAVDNR